MTLFIISGDMTPEKIGQIINQWKVNERPRLVKLWNYYLGNMAINEKTYEGNFDPSKPNNRVCSNFCSQIVTQYVGYNVGVPVFYGVDDKVQEFLNYNDVTDKDHLLLRDALIFGKSYELQWVDADKKNRFTVIPATQGIAIYDNELNTDDLKGFIRFYATEKIDGVNEKWKVEVYDKDEIKVYESDGYFNKLALVETIPHNFQQVPVSVFSLNSEEQGIFEQIMSLNDGYNTLMSSEINDWEAFVDAYLILKRVSVDEKGAASLKKQRVLMMDSDASAEYLTKQVNDSQIQNMLTNIKDNIFKLSNCPDFSDPNFMSSSRIALRYKLTGMSNKSKAIMNRMEKALRKRIELFQSIDYIRSGEDAFENVKISFTQNIPDSLAETAQVVNSLRGLVSDETLLSLLPFVSDVQVELERIKEQKENNFSFLTFNKNIEGDEDE